MELFVRRAGQVLSKDEILATVWDFDFRGDPNIVEVYVRQLRQRIDEPFGCQSLQTVRLAGYRLDAVHARLRRRVSVRLRITRRWRRC